MWTSDNFTVWPSQQQEQNHINYSSSNESVSSRSESSSSRSISPLPMDPISPVSSRSIFKNYWSSKSVDEEEHLSRALDSLQLPFAIAQDESSSCPAVDKVQEASHKDQFKQAPPRQSSIDDTPISHRQTPVDRSPQRRQILPAPPKSYAKLPPRPSRHESRGRRWSSTSALIKKPSGSCLRPSRYSFSGSLNDVKQANSPNSQPMHMLKKEVSFYAQVSVFEFTVPQEKRSEGWSNYFF
eukprot:scaffold9651_cov72-Cyclotella_meneghiniana.AAC.6